MLQAKKEALENTARRRLVAIREKELEYYTSNCRNIGQCAAIVSGLAYSGIRCVGSPCPPSALGGLATPTRASGVGSPSALGGLASPDAYSGASHCAR